LTAPFVRGSLEGALGNHEKRVAVLEANAAGAAGIVGPGFDIKAVEDLATVTVADGVFQFAIPEDLNGLKLISAEAYVSTVSSSGALTVQVRNITQAADMLSTAITIDQSEFTSYTAATPSVVNAGTSTVATGDMIAIDVDANGTGAKGLGVIVTFESTPPGVGATGPTGATGATGASAGELAYAQITADISVTATTEATSTAIVSSGAVTYAATPIMIEFWCGWAVAPNSAALDFLLYDDTTIVGWMGVLAVSASNMQTPIHLMRRLTPTAASHTYKIKAMVSGGTGTIKAGSGGTGVILPAFIRVTNA